MANTWLNYIWQQTELEGSLLLLAVAIADGCDNDGFYSAHVETLAKKVRLQVRQTQILIKKLETCRFLEVSRGAGRGLFNQFRLVKRVHSNVPITVSKKVHLDAERMHHDTPIQAEKVHQGTPLETEMAHSGAPINPETVCLSAPFDKSEKVHSSTPPLYKELPLEELDLDLIHSSKQPSGYLLEPQTENSVAVTVTREADSESSFIANDEEPKHPKRSKPSRTKKPSQADPRTSHPAIRLHLEITGRNPKKIDYDFLINQLGEEPDAEKAKRMFAVTRALGWNPTSYQWTLFYKTGVPSDVRKKAMVDANGYPLTLEEVEALSSSLVKPNSSGYKTKADQNLEVVAYGLKKAEEQRAAAFNPESTDPLARAVPIKQTKNLLLQGVIQ